MDGGQSLPCADVVRAMARSLIHSLSHKRMSVRMRMHINRTPVNIHIRTLALSFLRAWGVEWKRLKCSNSTGGSRQRASRRRAPVRWTRQREQ